MNRYHILFSLFIYFCCSNTNAINSKNTPYNISETDSIQTAKVDSITSVSDSLKTNNVITENLNLKQEFPKNEWKYFNVKERSPQEVYQLKTLYKNILKENYYNKDKAYDTWKTAFNSTEDRTIDMYVNGVEIILSKVYFDVNNNCFDSLSSHRDELMELYDLAVYNLDKLNVQIDKTKSGDTLSVAKLRSGQLKYYREITALDSVNNRNKDSKLNDWINIILDDSIHLKYMYPKYKDILNSSDLNINISEFPYIARIIRTKSKFEHKSEKEVALRNLKEDNALTIKRFQEVSKNMKPDDSGQYEKQYTLMENIIELTETQSITDPEELDAHLFNLYKKAKDNNRQTELVLEAYNRFADLEIDKINRNLKFYISVLGDSKRDSKSWYSYEFEKRRLYVFSALKQKKYIYQSVDALIKRFSKELDKDTSITQNDKYYIYLTWMQHDNINNYRKKEAIEYIEKMKIIYPQLPYAYYYETLFFEYHYEEIINNDKNYLTIGEYLYAINSILNDVKDMFLNKENETGNKEDYNGDLHYLVELSNNDWLNMIDDVINSNKEPIKNDTEIFMRGKNKDHEIEIDFSPYSNKTYKTIYKKN